MSYQVLVRGGGDLSSGVVFRLARVGIPVVVTEVAQPMVVRRTVAFAEAVFQGEVNIEGVVGRLARDLNEAKDMLATGVVPVLVDPPAQCRHDLQPEVIVDGRMTKRPPDLGVDAARIVVGLGPGFTAGVDCHAVVETRRGPFLGRVYYEGCAEEDTGIPETVGNFQMERVLRAPVDGVLTGHVAIGDWVEEGALIAEVDGWPIRANFAGRVRGLLHDGLNVTEGLKVGDLDPRRDERLCRLVSDKALAIGGGVLEVIFKLSDIRKVLCNGSPAGTGG